MWCAPENACVSGTYCGIDRAGTADHRIVGRALSNREIAEKLFLSEGTIKQYINRIYAKLQISGDVRTKRRQLIELLTAE